jgi:hypothetical protein
MDLTKAASHCERADVAGARRGYAISRRNLLPRSDVALRIAAH